MRSKGCTETLALCGNSVDVNPRKESKDVGARDSIEKRTREYRPTPLVNSMAGRLVTEPHYIKV